MLVTRRPGGASLVLGIWRGAAFTALVSGWLGKARSPVFLFFLVLGDSPLPTTIAVQLACDTPSGLDSLGASNFGQGNRREGAAGAGAESSLHAPRTAIAGRSAA